MLISDRNVAAILSRPQCVKLDITSCNHGRPFSIIRVPIDIDIDTEIFTLKYSQIDELYDCTRIYSIFTVYFATVNIKMSTKLIDEFSLNSATLKSNDKLPMS